MRALTMDELEFVSGGFNFEEDSRQLVTPDVALATLKFGWQIYNEVDDDYLSLDEAGAAIRNQGRISESTNYERAGYVLNIATYSNNGYTYAVVTRNWGGNRRVTAITRTRDTPPGTPRPPTEMWDPEYSVPGGGSWVPTNS